MSSFLWVSPPLGIPSSGCPYLWVFPHFGAATSFFLLLFYVNIFKNNVDEQSLKQQATSKARLILENVREFPCEIDLCVQGQSIHITGYQLNIRTVENKENPARLVTTTPVQNSHYWEKVYKGLRNKNWSQHQDEETPRGGDTQMRE